MEAMGSTNKQSLSGNIHRIREFELEKINLIDEFDILQIVGEGWFGKILLVEHKATDTEMVLKALPKPYTSIKDFYREFHYGLHLSAHKNIISTYDVAFETAGFYVFSQEYAPLGDLTSNVSEIGIGEIHTKRVAKQLASALEHMHKRDLVHRDVKLDNVLVFKSDFTRIKLCDFGETRPTGTVVLRRNEWLPYAAPEILEIETDGNYTCTISHDVWQFGIVIFVCLTGCLPWQKAAHDDPRYNRYVSWHNSNLPIKRIPKLFKLISSKAQRFFKRYLEPKVEKRPSGLADVSRYLDDRWMSKGMEKTNETLKEEEGLCPSMYSFHSSPEEKNKLLFTLTQYGLETTVDRNAKKDRIRQWIQNSIIVEEDEAEEEILDEENIKIHDNRNGPVGEQRPRGPVSEQNVRLSQKSRSRRERHAAIDRGKLEVYKPPIDPRLPFEKQKQNVAGDTVKQRLVNKLSEDIDIQDAKQKVSSDSSSEEKSSLKENIPSTNGIDRSHTNGHINGYEKVMNNSTSLIKKGRRMFSPTRIKVTENNTKRHDILSALPYKNLQLVSSSPTTSGLTLQSSSNTGVRHNIKIQVSQGKSKEVGIQEK